MFSYRLCCGDVVAADAAAFVADIAADAAVFVADIAVDAAVFVTLPVTCLETAEVIFARAISVPCHKIVAVLAQRAIVIRGSRLQLTPDI